MQRFPARYQAANNNCTNTNDKNVPIRTVYVAPIKSNMSNKVKGFFERFGIVEAVRFHNRDDYQFGFVQFKSTEDAQIVLSIGSHRIANQVVKVKAADPWHQPEFQQPPDPLLIPDQESPSNILIALNDDCLREVFKYLNVKDLINAAETCIRFNKHAKDAFAQKYNELNLRDELQSLELKSLLGNFGASIKSLKVNADLLSSANYFVDLIAQNESNGSSQLKDLELKNFEIKGKLAKKLRPLFSPLEHLQLTSCHLRGEAKNLLDTCKEMKTLNFDGCDTGNGKCIKQKFGKLEEAVFLHSMDLKEDALIHFIKLNPTLKKLEFSHNNMCSMCNMYSSNLIRAIGEHLPNLSELHIEEMIENMAQQIPVISRLNFLKVLKLDFNGELIAPLMKNLAEKNVPIEHLKIIEGEINNDAIDSIAKMKKINCLELVEIDQDFTEENLIQIAKELPELRELHLIDVKSEITTIGLRKMLSHANKLSLLKLESMYSITIDIDDYKTILKTVQNRPEKVKLLIELTCNGDKINVPEEILAANRDTFYINETIEDDNPMTVSGYSYENSDFDDWTDDYYPDSDDYFAYHDSDVDSEDGYGMGFINGGLFYLG